MGRKSRRSRAAKLSRDGHATRPPSLVAGQVYGELRVIEPDTGERQSGKRVALVEDTKTGVRKRVIASNVTAGGTVSDGRIKRARYAEWIENQKQAARYTNIDELDPELLNAGLALHSNDVDVTGKPLKDQSRRLVDRTLNSFRFPLPKGQHH